MKNELKKGALLQDLADWFRSKTRCMTEEQALMSKLYILGSHPGCRGGKIQIEFAPGPEAEGWTKEEHERRSAAFYEKINRILADRKRRREEACGEEGS